MTEAEKLWLRTNDHPRDLLELVEGRPITGPLERKWRLFLCGIAWRVERLAEQPNTRQLITAAESYADGGLSQAALENLSRSASHGISLMDRSRSMLAFNAVLATGFRSGSLDTFDVAVYAVDDAGNATDDSTAEWAAQAAIIKDVFGNPFRPLLQLDPAVGTWNNGLAIKMAQAIYEDRDFTQESMGVLADALEEAGVDDASLLDHLRGPGSHCRGCFAIDAVLGRD